MRADPTRALIGTEVWDDRPVRAAGIPVRRPRRRGNGGGFW
ncbi:hypothetical protein [Nocardia sp. NPDC048505]